uniref:Uncharacterized protein n=1 Tax=Magallana gigas TaxID=29159 RepID=A0A8W8NS46_MAGGI|nr:uncharacterized protein LOC105324616 isoform X1 [Crassostrea gigas]XP_011422039.2 uncharacterized protein LOC105324616 isoform X1 [Crassostrea gigas]
MEPPLYQRVKPGFSEIVGENIEVDLDPAGNPVKAKWNFSNSCGLAFSGSPLGDNRKYEIIFSGSGHARIGLTQNDPDHIRDIQEAVRKNQILFVSDVRYHKRQCVVDIMKKDGIGGSKFVTKYKDDNPQIKDLLSSNDVWAVIYLKFGNITAEIKDKDSGANLKFHKKRDRNIKPSDSMISLRSPIPFAYACAEKGISRGQGIRVRVEHIKHMEKKPNSFHLGIGISEKKLKSGSSLDIAPFLFKKLEKDECLGEFFVCISKKGKFHLCRGDLCIYSKALPTEMNPELPLYVCFEIFRVQIELMDTSYCEHSEAVENPGEEPKSTENIPPETTDPSYVIFEMFNAIRIVDEDIKSRKMTPEVRKFSDDLTEYVKHISLDRSNAEYLTPISTRLAEGEGKPTLTINDLLKKLEGIEKTIVEQHLERQQDYMKILEAIKVNREKIAEKRVDSGVFTNHLQNTCADFIANVDAFPLCDHLLQIGIFHQIQFETILDEHKLSRQDANRSLFRILVKKEYTPEQLRSIWKAFSVTKQDSLLPKLDPS